MAGSGIFSNDEEEVKAYRLPMSKPVFIFFVTVVIMVSFLLGWMSYYWIYGSDDIHVDCSSPHSPGSSPASPTSFTSPLSPLIYPFE